MTVVLKDMIDILLSVGIYNLARVVELLVVEGKYEIAQTLTDHRQEKELLKFNPVVNTLNQSNGLVNVAGKLIIPLWSGFSQRPP